MPLHCEHCANKDKSKWLSDCLYKGSYPSHRAFALSTFDPPCAMDAYDQGQREIAQRRHRQSSVTIVAVLAVVLGLLYWFF